MKAPECTDVEAVTGRLLGLSFAALRGSATVLCVRRLGQRRGLAGIEVNEATTADRARNVGTGDITRGGKHPVAAAEFTSDLIRHVNLQALVGEDFASSCNGG